MKVARYSTRMLLKFADLNEVYDRNPELRKTDVGYLQKWLEKQPHLPPIIELEIIMFLHSCYYSIEKTKETIDNYFTIKTMCPELFGHKDLEKFKASMNEAVYAPLPSLTSEGYQVVLIKLLNCNPYTYVFENHVKYITSYLTLFFAEKGPTNGVVFVLDMDGFSLVHLTRAPLSLLKTGFEFLQEALPVRLKEVHCINTAPFIDKVLILIKPFMKVELLNIIHFHQRNSQSLYKHVPLENLPSDYGGNSKSIAIVHETTKAFILNNMDLIENEEKRLVDESKRQNKSKFANDLFGTDGSFKKLEVD